MQHLSILACLTVEMLLVSGVREKRVIHGIPLLERDTSYRAVQYYVFLGKDSSNNPRHHGGGALITPKIVQTACHVISSPNYVEVKGQPISRAVLLDHWSHRLFAFIGYNNIRDPKHHPIGSLRYHIHLKCGRIIQGMGEQEHWVLHDFGWIWLSENVDELIDRKILPNKFIQYTPQYTVRDLGRHYNHATSSRSVCLTMGYGVTRLLDDKCVDRSCADDLTTPSEVLRHGWNVMIDYKTCFYLSRAWYNNPGWYYEPVEYKDIATWICAAGIPQFGNKTTIDSRGDSGSPVTCNNAYVSIVSISIHEKLYNGIFSPAIPALQATSAVAFAAFENSIEFRITFEAFMDCGCYDSHSAKGTSGSNTYGPGIRMKRIIYGKPLLERDTPYDVVLYHVWVSNPYHDSYNPTHAGGGALITTRIIQLSCHQLSTIKVVKGKSLSVATVIHWNQLRLVHMGYNKISDLMDKGIRSSKFYIHQNCGKLLQGEPTVEYWVSNDFGWIWLSEDVDSVIEQGRLPNKNIAYAPQYTVRDLGRNFNHVSTSRSVCLFMGYGATFIDPKYYEMDPLSVSQELLHGWMTFYDYKTCYVYARGWFDKELSWDYYPVDYNSVATWFCSSGMPNFGNRTEMPSNADSGSPVTCDNRYTAIVSSGARNIYKGIFTPAIPYLHTSSALAYAAFENSFDFRITFEAFMDCGCYGSHGEKGWDFTFRPWRKPIEEDLRPRPLSFAPQTSLSLVCFALLILQFQL